MEYREHDVLSLMEVKTADYQDRVALGIRNAYGWKEFTYKGLGLLSRKLASYLICDLETKKGDKLAILSESKPEYGACVFASVLAGFITVPLDVKLTKFELKSILMDAEPTVILVSQTYIEMAKFLKDEVPSLKYIIVMDEYTRNSDIQNIYELPERYNAKWRRRSSKSTAFIIYTSGTTGSPKGVEITFRNITSQLEDLKVPLSEILPNKKVTVLSILPMNHLFEMTVGFCTFLNFGFSVYYSQSLKPKDIACTMRDKRVGFMIVVPAFLKLLKAGIENELRAEPKFTQILFEFMYHLSKFIPSYKIKKLLFRKIHSNFGGNFVGCISGGAPLDVEVGKFFERIGIKIYQGYGLSETSPVVSVNTNKCRKLSSVGKPLNSFEVKIMPETGELCLKGPSVMKGYHNQPKMTSDVIDADGWLHTGDIAGLDKDGHIHITGRIKNLIVLQGGKKVFPEEVESVLEKSNYISEVCVLGSSKTFGSKGGSEEVVAVCVPKEELFMKYSMSDIEAIIKADVKSLSLQLTQYKRPSSVIVSKNPLPKTTTRKIKRNDVKQLITV